MIQKGLYEILESIDKARGEAEKLRLLAKYSSPALKAIIGHAYDPNVKWALPDTDPPYKPMPKENDQQGRLFTEIRRFYVFLEGTNNLKPHKREQLFIELLESIDPDDAKLMCSIKNKKLPFKSITPALIKKAYPNLTKDW